MNTIIEEGKNLQNNKRKNLNIIRYFLKEKLIVILKLNHMLKKKEKLQEK